MNSLTTGVWGSFSTPYPRALGGKSGMTRAAPLVCFAQPAPLQFADCMHMLFLVLLSAFLWFADLPPDGRPQLFPIPLKQACQEQPETSRARARERQSGSVQNEGASERAHALFSACARDERRAKSAS